MFIHEVCLEHRKVKILPELLKGGRREINLRSNSHAYIPQIILFLLLQLIGIDNFNNLLTIIQVFRFPLKNSIPTLTPQPFLRERRLGTSPHAPQHALGELWGDNFKMADEPLLLGLPDGNMEENDDKICGWTTNKIGGTPVSNRPSR